MAELDKSKAVDLLNRILEAELAGVVRYTHYSLLVFGFNRIPIVAWLREQAAESLAHAQQAGEMITHLGDYPSLAIGPLLDTHRTDIGTILRESLESEGRALALYKHLRPALARGSGGLSGPVLKPVALHAVSVCHETTGLPIVGMGGIETGRDALEFAACGARDVALGTVLFADPGAPRRVRAELAAACEDAGVANPEDAQGLAKSPETERKVPA